MFGLSINLDVSSLASLSDNLRKMFVRMMNYATNLNSNTKRLVNKLVKAISETERSDPSVSHADSELGDGPPSSPPPPSGQEG
jgi:predicted transcriptional regulator YheO